MSKPAKNPAAVALGRIRSPRKAAASRENGRRGGRPRKVAVATVRIVVLDREGRKWPYQAESVQHAVNVSESRWHRRYRWTRRAANAIQSHPSADQIAKGGDWRAA